MNIGFYCANAADMRRRLGIKPFLPILAFNTLANMITSKAFDAYKSLSQFYGELALSADRQYWEDPAFCHRKGYLCCLASQVAYEHIPWFELANTDRCSIVPCERYQINALIGIENKKSFAGIALNIGNDENGMSSIAFFLQTPLAIVIGIRFQDVGLIALRGTELAFNIFGLPRSITRAVLDLDADLDFAQKAYNNQYRYCFDRGFYEACDSIYELVKLEVARKFPDDTPIYLTGHSLGGSMAAIMLARWCDDHQKELTSHQYRSENSLIQKPTACYSFGMPRYANEGVMADLALPWHIYNYGDSIITVPPESNGYVDLPCEREYILDSKSKILSHSQSAPKGNTQLRVGSVVHFFKGIPNHMMEQYLEGMKACAAKVGPPTEIDIQDEYIIVDGVKLPINRQLS